LSHIYTELLFLADYSGDDDKKCNRELLVPPEIQQYLDDLVGELYGESRGYTENQYK
jgi:hypothetical protein